MLFDSTFFRTEAKARTYACRSKLFVSSFILSTGVLDSRLVPCERSRRSLEDLSVICSRNASIVGRGFLASENESSGTARK